MGQGQTSHYLDLPALFDFVCGVALMDGDARNHVKNCEQCRADITWLQWLVDFGSREGAYDPPSWAVSNAENVFRLKKPGLVTIAKETVASLIYDSFNEPLPIGVRRRDLPSRQALYQAGPVQLDLKIELGDEKGLIIGQIISDEDSFDVNGLKIEIAQHGQVMGKSTTNALGEFIFEDLPKGNYELQVLLSDTMVKLPPLPLND